MLWHIELEFCIRLCFTVLQIKFECRQFGAEILHMILFNCTTDKVQVSSICVKFCRSYAPFGTWILEIHSFPHFSPTGFDILSWNFAYDFVLLFYRWSSSVVNFCRNYAPFGTSNTGNTQFSAPFSCMLWHIELNFCIWLSFTELQIKMIIVDLIWPKNTTLVKDLGRLLMSASVKIRWVIWKKNLKKNVES